MFVDALAGCFVFILIVFACVASLENTGQRNGAVIQVVWLRT